MALTGGKTIALMDYIILYVCVTFLPVSELRKKKVLRSIESEKQAECVKQIN